MKMEIVSEKSNVMTIYIFNELDLMCQHGDCILIIMGSFCLNCHDLSACNNLKD